MADETVSYGRESPRPPAISQLGNRISDRRNRRAADVTDRLRASTLRSNTSDRAAYAISTLTANALSERAQTLSSATAWQDHTSLAIKRVIDVFGAACGIIALAPLLVCIAIAVKATSRGPVLFRQERQGWNGSTFTAFKFRSMYTDRCDPTGVSQTVRNDPRITRVGRVLRRNNLDELPQLFNVLKGEMSLVGPRPHVPGMLAAGIPYEEFDPRYRDRHKLRPGITGLAQINGFRGETTSRHAARMRLEYDLAYIMSRSTLMDIRIILVTMIREVFKGTGD